MSCVLCKQDNFLTVSKKDAKNNAFLKVSFCKSCGMVQQEPIPTDEEVGEYYATEYRLDYKKTFAPKLKHILRAGNLALDRITFLQKNGIAEGKLLDVGAGGGEFTYLCGLTGFESEGVEPNVGYSDYAQNEYGVNIKTGQLSDVEGQFQVITMFHVLEHIPNPVTTFEKLWGLLIDKGYLFIEVPNIETNDASPHNIYFKAHIHYFSEATLISAASPYFELIMIENQSNLRIIFRKKSASEKLVLPSKAQVDNTNKRLQQKGWLEYIFRGKACQKLYCRIKTIIIEANLPKQSGLDLLQKIFDNKLK